MTSYIIHIKALHFMTFQNQAQICYIHHYAFNKDEGVK